jgi:hypothetical protein
MILLFKKYDLSFLDVELSEDLENIQLKVKDTDDKKLLTDYEETTVTNERREILKSYSKLVNDSTRDGIINFQGYLYPPVFIKCIYNDYIGRGGRIYAQWQNMKGTDRKKITIDNSEVVEVDIRSCSLRIATHLLNLDLEQDDLYQIGSYDRSHVKPIVQEMLNMTDGRTLKQRFNDISNTKAVQKELDTNDTEYIKTVARDIYDYYDTDEMNKLSSTLFFKDKGMTLIMPVESAVTMDVIKDFTDDNEIILTVHDSFICKKELLSKLIKSLVTNYSKHLHHQPIITREDKVIDISSYS